MDGIVNIVWRVIHQKRRNRLLLLLLPPANVVCEGYVFTTLCDSVNRGGRCIPACLAPALWQTSPLGRHPPGRHPPGRHTHPWADTPPVRHTPLGRHPPGQTPPRLDTPLGKHRPPSQTPPGTKCTPRD